MADKPGVLRNLRIKRVALVDVGANFDRDTGDGAHIMLFKRAINKDGPGLGAVHVDRPLAKDGEDPLGCPCPNCDGADQEEYEKATLDAESRSKIPDSKFLAVWTDAQGKKHRKLPVHDAGHLAAARGRIDSAQMPADVKAAAHRKLEHLSPKEKSVAKKTIADVIKLLTSASAEKDEVKKAAILKEADELSVQVAKDMAPPVAEGSDKLDPAHIDAMKAAHANMGKAISAFGAGPHPPEHPVHAMKAAHQKMTDCLKAAGVETPTDEPGGLGELAVSKAIAKATTEIQKQLDIEKGLRLDREMYDILKDFKKTPLKIEGADKSDIAKFRKMKESDAEGFERMLGIMKAADAALADSALYRNFGAGGGGGGDAWAQIEAKADSMVEKNDKLTREQAIEKVLLQHPKLAAQYRAEQQ